MITNQQIDKISDLKRAAEAGDVTAQFKLGDIYEHGKGVKRNLHMAKNYYEMAANQGDSEAQLALGFLYSRDKGFERNFPKAKFWFEKAAHQGDAIAQINLAELYEKGKGVDKDYHKAFALYKNVAEKDNVFGYIPLAKMYWHGLGTEKDPEKAKYWLEKGAKELDPACVFNLIYLLTHSPENPNGYRDARHWLEKILPEMIIHKDINRIFHHPHESNLWGNDTHIANWFYEEAKAGDSEAISSLVILIEKEVISLDEKLITALEKADTISNPKILHILGNAFLLGKKVQKDYTKAEKLLLEAANRGWTDTYFDLANLYKNFLHDYGKALPYLYKAVENGNMDAYLQLGDMYQDGLGIEKDWSKAEYYYGMAKKEELLIPISEYFIGKLYEIGDECFPKNMDKAIEHYVEAAKFGSRAAEDKLNKLNVPLPDLNYQGYLATKSLRDE